MPKSVEDIREIILSAEEKAREETKGEPEPGLTQPIEWPVECSIGPGLEGAIACESKIGYVNGSKGWLIYRGYEIFDLCANSCFEEVSYLLIHGHLPAKSQLKLYREKLIRCMSIPDTTRSLTSFPVEQMNTMVALRLGISLLRLRPDYWEQDISLPGITTYIGTDEDSIPMETPPTGEAHAVYEIQDSAISAVRKDKNHAAKSAEYEACYSLIGALASITATIARTRQNRLPIEPKQNLSFAGNLLYMMTGAEPDPVAERIMDIALILHADHGMNASTFAAMVVASTLADINFSIGTGVAALSGPLHGGANEQVIAMLKEIGPPGGAAQWLEEALREKRKIMGFGHRVYKAYDPRARILGPLAEYLIRGENGEPAALFRTAVELEKAMLNTLGRKKRIFPNVDFYSGIVYTALEIPMEFFTPLFAVSRVAGWTARVLEYLENNRIFRPRAVYTGHFDKKINH